MLQKNDDGSSSSEDEICKDALKEAVNNEFFKDAYFSKEKSNQSQITRTSNGISTCLEAKETVNAKSLRKSQQEDEKFENFGVTASFQKFVAKKLDEIIERSIRLTTKAGNDLLINENEIETANKSGVRLLTSSTEFLTTLEEGENFHVPKKRRKKEEIEEDSRNIAKCKEVAVEPERILSKLDTKAWTNKRKEPEFKYKKLKNGTLIEKA